VLARGGVIAGCSAGAMILGAYLLTGVGFLVSSHNTR